MTKRFISKTTVSAFVYALPLALLLSAPATLAEEKFPTRPIDMVVNFGPGGGADNFGRIVARLLERELSVSLPVSNISGASGTTGLTRVLTATPDGYTIGTMTGISVSSWAAGLGQLKIDQFAYVSVAQSSPSMLFVTKDSKFKSFKDLLDYAKQNPNKVRVATAGYGTLDDISVKFLTAKGYPMVNVPFARPGERYISPIGGHTEALFEEPGDVVQFLQSKSLRPLVVFGRERHPSFPDVPASAELGLDIDLPNWRAIVTGAKVSPANVKTLYAAMTKALATDEWKKFCSESYTCIAPKSPEESAKFVKKNYDDLRKFMLEYGILKR